jgi:hypothetical protein
LLIDACVSIEAALKKLKLSHHDGVRSKALTDQLAKELAIAVRDKAVQSPRPRTLQ